jgi:DNA invertase Pin-like site-specific DNA recombinase
MVAAVYARKSTKDDREEHAKSVETQCALAKAFAAKQGWDTEERYVYVDDGVSGALFLGRPAFQQMLRDADVGAFDVVVLFDLDRLGRHAQKSMEALNALADAGVDVYDCSSGQKVDVESFEGEITTSLKALFAQQFREQIRKHTRAAMQSKAKQGWSTGGRIFGYDNLRVSKGHVELRINEHEATVVRDIYRRAAMGEGARTIARALNHAKLPSPRPQQGRPHGWSASTIHAVLRRPLYRGDVVYGRTAKAYNRELRKVYRGTKREKGQIPKPEETWIRKHVPALAIIDPDLAVRVDAKLDDRRARYLAAVKQGDGRAPHKAFGKYLLSGGMLLCASCGGHFEARKYPWKPLRKTAAKLPPHARVGHPGEVYICSTRRRKPGVCTNTLALPITETDDAVLSTIAGDVLGPDFINQLLTMVENAPDERTWLAAERDRLRSEVERLVASIAAGVPADSVASLIRSHEAKIAGLEKRLRVPMTPRLEAERLRAALEQRAKQWKRELRKAPKIARMVLRELIGPITLWDESLPEQQRPEFIEWQAPTKPGLLAGLGATLLEASPTGFEPVFWP